MPDLFPPKPFRCLSLYVLLFLAVTSGSVSASNGTLAIAVPVEGITVDGHLLDWPEGMTAYPIQLQGHGSAPTGPADPLT